VNRNVVILFFAVIVAQSALANAVNMDDPRRAVGREDDIRIDAQLMAESVAPGAPVGVVWQIQNFSSDPVAVDPGTVNASFDAETGTITIGIGAEIPQDGRMPSVELVGAGEMKSFRSGATPRLHAARISSGFDAMPRLVRIKVTIVRDVEPFISLIRSGSTKPLSNDLFERWFEVTETIFLNTLPVYYSPRATLMSAQY
jgi:hypothetical protein